MLVRKIKYRNGREVYRKTDLLEKIKYYEDLIYSCFFAGGIIAVIVFMFIGLIGA